MIALLSLLLTGGVLLAPPFGNHDCIDRGSALPSRLGQVLLGSLLILLLPSVTVCFPDDLPLWEVSDPLGARLARALLLFYNNQRFILYRPWRSACWIASGGRTM